MASVLLVICACCITLSLATDVSLRVDVNHFRRHGFVIVSNVFHPDEITSFRDTILHQLGSGVSPHFGIHPVGNATAAFESGQAETSIPNFASLREFRSVAALVTDPRIHSILEQVFDGADSYRFCSHNDIGVNRAVGWHKDWLNNEYARYQKLPLFEDATGDGGHFIVKVAIYLQDHSDNSDSLALIPGSHTDPVIRPAAGDAKTVHPASGALIVFNQLITHRGRTSPSSSGTMRILVSLDFGKKNNYTDEFETGTILRQTHQLKTGTKQMRLRLSLKVESQNRRRA